MNNYAVTRAMREPLIGYERALDEFASAFDPRFHAAAQGFGKLSLHLERLVQAGGTDRQGVVVLFPVEGRFEEFGDGNTVIHAHAAFLSFQGQDNIVVRADLNVNKKHFSCNDLLLYCILNLDSVHLAGVSGTK